MNEPFLDLMASMVADINGEEGMHHSLTESVYKVVLQKSIPAQICQLILYYH